MTARAPVPPAYGVRTRRTNPFGVRHSGTPAADPPVAERTAARLHVGEPVILELRRQLVGGADWYAPRTEDHAEHGQLPGGLAVRLAGQLSRVREERGLEHCAAAQAPSHRLECGASTRVGEEELAPVPAVERI